MKNHFLFLVALFFLVSHENTYAKSHNLPSTPTFLTVNETFEKNDVDNEFEGSYKVGNTSCTVKPIKMAFQVKWLKGRGSMIFFFDQTTADGKTIFVSEASDKGRDQFVFDDNQYKSGVFIRGDGKVFAVERLTMSPSSFR